MIGSGSRKGGYDEPKAIFPRKNQRHAKRGRDSALSRGMTVGQISRQLSISEQTYYRWCKAYGGLKVSQAKRMKDIERENIRLKKAVAELTLDKVILKEALEGNF